MRHHHTRGHGHDRSDKVGHGYGHDCGGDLTGPARIDIFGDNFDFVLADYDGGIGRGKFGLEGEDAGLFLIDRWGRLSLADDYVVGDGDHDVTVTLGDQSIDVDVFHWTGG